jgi:malate dehydrogenase (oxaloacetate-decarboxylating)(NADP+)
MEVVQQVKPTALIGLSGQGGSFSPSILEELFKHSQRPIVFPLSNPTSNSETDAKTCYTLSKGRCIFASGSPFAPVEVNGKMYYPGQGNNMYIFPGLGFGAWLCGAKVVTDRMISAAARSLADQVSEKELREGNLYPAISNIRAIEMEIAAKVMEVAYEEGVAQHPRPINLKEHVTKNVYWPQYATVYSNL